MPSPRYQRLIRQMADSPQMGDQSVEYGAEIVTGGEAGVADTIVLVSDEAIYARPMQGKEDESTLELTIPLSAVTQLECPSIFADGIPIETSNGQYTIPTSGLDTVKFTSSVVENSQLTNGCERFGFGSTRFTVTKWSLAVGSVLVLVGVAFCVTVIGILVGLPFIGIGGLMLLFAFAYTKAGDWMGDNVWALPEASVETA
ncbi:MAG: hypothetical protein ABEJ27_00400 [Halodesulfurarchaeum sp.]